MRAVLDTNILVSAFLFGGTPLDVVSLAESSAIEVITSEAALSEFAAVLSRTKFRGRLKAIGVSARAIVSRYRALAAIVDPDPGPAVCEDPEDDEFISVAVAGSADFIVSGDRHLLTCADRSPVPIVTAAECLAIVAALAESP